MPGLFQGISTMSGALRAFQNALDITGNNVSNVNTPGYSRQVVHFNEMEPTIQGNLSVGNGVSADSISRIQDRFLYSRQIAASSENGRSNALSTGLGNVQSITNATTGNSIGDNLDAFFNAWSALGSSPNNDALRQQVQQAGETLASSVSGMYSNLQAQQAQNNASISGTIQQAQTLTNQIDSLNKEIINLQSLGATPNDLLDQRDQAVQQLSQLIPVTMEPQANGSVNLYSGQMTLVDQSGAATLPTAYDASSGVLTNGSITFAVGSGQLGGEFQLSQKISSYQGQLDTLANTLRTQFNSIHQTGINELGATNQNFFQDVPAGQPQTGAVDFQVDPAIVADDRAIATGVSGNSGDGGLALSMSNLRSSTIPALGGQTLSSYFSGMVTGIGQDASAANTQINTSNAVMQQIGQQIQSVSGVSIDEEMTNLLQFQRSYQAAAKALSVFDQTTNDLMNIIQ